MVSVDVDVDVHVDGEKQCILREDGVDNRKEWRRLAEDARRRNVIDDRVEKVIILFCNDSVGIQNNEGCVVLDAQASKIDSMDMKHTSILRLKPYENIHDLLT